MDDQRLEQMFEVLRRYFVYDTSYRAMGAHEILHTADVCNVACTSAQVQIYGPRVGPICDIDWIMSEPEARATDEPWNAYVTRANAEIERWLRSTWHDTDWRQLVYEVGGRTPYLAAMEKGADPRDWILLEMFFATENGSLPPLG